MPNGKYRTKKTKKPAKKGPVKNSRDIKKLQKVVKRIMPELKQVRSEYPTDEYDRVGQVTRITDIAIGTNGDNRIGNEITIKKITYKGFAQLFNGNVSGIIRILLVMDTRAHANGSVPLPDLSSILQYTNNQCVIAPMNLNEQGRWKILAERVFHLKDFNKVDGKLYSIEYNKPIRVTYQRSTADPCKNAIYIMSCGDAFSATPNDGFSNLIVDYYDA